MKKTSFFTKFAIILSILGLIGIILYFVALSDYFTSAQKIFDIIIILVIFVPVIVLCFALGEARERITVLEDTLITKKLATKTDLYGDEVLEEDEMRNNGIKLCKKCGYQIFPEENECSQCGTKVRR